MNARCLGILAAAALLFGSSLGAKAGVFYDLEFSPTETSGGNISAAGQTVSIDLFARVVGAANNSAAEGFQEGYGSIVSSSTGSGTISGGLSAALETPFNATGSRSGASQELSTTSDNVLDLGSNLTVASPEFFYARAGHLQPYQSNGVGETITDGMRFKLATVTFTYNGDVNSLMAGDTVTLSFQVPAFSSKLNFEALWMEDGIFKTYNAGSSNAAPQTGLSVTLMVIPEPSSALLLGLGALAAGSVRRRRAS